ncbi:conserved hypothetical protein [Pediculus humanus corporis]|uniref:Anaphase-promoting complex subunit 4-like WD40 domain-containing protein n=1 Tax=Pediculus humanus subsp. corporis TaxID=121224 RepID=E0VID8_PEDHC|nr:uncharacterized protein Phum_PHUM226320 [Pediculus humanus corporis]EEB13144.1 conserved hypothetical protein [Pediculus humanus corporis]
MLGAIDYEKRLYLKQQCEFAENIPQIGEINVSPITSPLAKPMLERFRSPTKCPNADRFIPSRSENWETKYAMISENSSIPALRKARESGETGRDGLAYSYLLKNEVLGSNIEDIKTNCDERRALSTIEGSNLFHYQSPKKRLDFNEPTTPYSLSPVSCYSQKLLRSPRKATRKISRIPFKVLDAPELQDDFYLNLVDWSSQNVLSVGLGSCVYLWSACNSQVTRLCDLSSDGNSVTSVAWNERGNLVAVGTHHGQVQVWDVTAGKQVCNLAWSKHSSELVSTHGYSQNQILVWKYPSLVQVAKLTGHSYRVLYLAMSPDGESIVTGAGDETLRFWSVFSKARTQKENRSVLNLFTNIR